MAEAVPALPVTAARPLLILSAAALLGGLYFPLAVIVAPGPSAMAYGILVVSFPAWAMGVMTALLGGWLAGREESPAWWLRTGAGALAALNLLAIVVCALWNPPGVS